MGFLFGLFFFLFIPHLLYRSLFDFFGKTSLFDVAFPELRGQRDGEVFPAVSSESIQVAKAVV